MFVLKFSGMFLLRSCLFFPFMVFNIIEMNISTVMGSLSVTQTFNTTGTIHIYSLYLNFLTTVTQFEIRCSSSTCHLNKME